MKSLIIIISFQLLFFHFNLFAQEQSHDTGMDYEELVRSVKDQYGLDQVLANGVFYKNNYLNVAGHQFFPDGKLSDGTLIYKGREYKNVAMKYDIYDQELILYLHHNNLAVWIVPPDDFITAFGLSDKYFSKYNIMGEPRFYQVVFDTEKLKCLYYWSKQINEVSHGGNTISFRFSEGEKDMFLNLDGPFEQFRNNRSFIEIFPTEAKDMVRQYIKMNHIKITKSIDEEVYELFNYCISFL